MPFDKRIELIREFPDRSIKWLLETPDNLHSLLLVVAENLADMIDYKRIKLLDRTFISDDFKKLEADIVFKAPFLYEDSNVKNEFINYILIEHQSSVNNEIAFRVLSYMIRIWESQRKEWSNNNIAIDQRRFNTILPIVFYTGNQQWKEFKGMRQLVDVPPILEGLIPQHEIYFLNLKASSQDQLVKKDNPFGWILTVINKENSDSKEFEKILREVSEHLQGMSESELENWTKLMHFLLALIYHRRDQKEHERLLKIIEETIPEKTRKEEVKEMGQTMAQYLMEQGEKKGKIEGKIEGKKEGLVEAVSLGLELKFGADGLILMEKVQKVESLEQLELIKEAIKINNNLSDIEKLI